MRFGGLLLFASLVSACDAGSAFEPIGRTSVDPGVEAFDAKADGDAYAELIASLTTQYGVRPRRYNGVFQADKEADFLFTSSLPVVADFLNQRVVANGGEFTIDMAEIATNFLTEGGVLALKDNTIANIDGFGYLGIDTLVDNLAPLRPWLYDEILAEVAAGNTATSTNELGQPVTTLRSVDILQGLHANGGMYTWSKSQAAHDFKARGLSLASLPRPQQAFWTTIYYNAGSGIGRRLLDQYGPAYAERVWTGEPNSQAARYNATWRAASYDFMYRTVFGGNGSLKPFDPSSLPPWRSDTVQEHSQSYDPPMTFGTFEAAVKDWGKVDSAKLVVTHTDTPGPPATLGLQLTVDGNEQWLEASRVVGTSVEYPIARLGATASGNYKLTLPGPAKVSSVSLSIAYAKTEPYSLKK
jgi:hypothetical protein